MGSKAGVEKVAAKRVGLTLEEYRAKKSAGLKRCTKCHSWKQSDGFYRDSYRGDGLSATCIDCLRVVVLRKRVGFFPTRQEQQAAADAVRNAIKRGRLAKPTTVPCLDCGKAAQVYHHHLGYERRHRLTIVALCHTCHVRRHWE